MHVSYRDLIGEMHRFAVQKFDESRDRDPRYAAAAIDTAVDKLKVLLVELNVDLDEKVVLHRRELKLFIIACITETRHQTRSFRRKAVYETALENLDEFYELLKKKYLSR